MLGGQVCRAVATHRSAAQHFCQEEQADPGRALVCPGPRAVVLVGTELPTLHARQVFWVPTPSLLRHVTLEAPSLALSVTPVPAHPSFPGSSQPGSSSAWLVPGTLATGTLTG